MAIKGKSRRRSRPKAPTRPPRPAIGARKTALPLRRDVKRGVVIVLAVLAFLGGLRVWQNVSRSDALRDYDKAITTAQGSFITHFTPNAPSNVDQNVQAFQAGKLAPAAFMTLCDQWEKDFVLAVSAIHKLKGPNPVIADAQFLIEQSIQSYVRTVNLWNFAGQLKLLANAEKDKKKNTSLNDKIQVLLQQADDLRKQHGDLLYQRGATEITNLNIEYGLQKPQPQSTPTQ